MRQDRDTEDVGEMPVKVKEANSIYSSFFLFFIYLKNFDLQTSRVLIKFEGADAGSTCDFLMDSVGTLIPGQGVSSF